MRTAFTLGLVVALTGACKEAPSSGGVASDPSAMPLPSATIAALTPSTTGSPTTTTTTSTSTTTSTTTPTSTAPTPSPSPAAPPSPSPSLSAPPHPPAKPVFAHFGGTGYAVDLSASGCVSGADCTLVIRLQAQAPYHVNKEYPYKFTANDAANVVFLGAEGGKVFSRGSGAFAQQGEAAATVTVRFRGSAAGTATVAGPFRLSVCTDTECKIDVANVSLAVPIL
jgi:hypothetical protein